MANKKIVGMFMLGLLLLIATMAFTSAFLTVKSFDNDFGNHGKIKINDWLGLVSVADYVLTDYKSSVINVWAEGEYKLYKKTHLFTGVFYEDTFGNKGELKDVKFFIWKNESYQEEKTIFDNSCDGIIKCTPNTIGSETITKYNATWITYEEGMDLDESEGRWRLEAKRKANKPVDFILEAHGKTFDEWQWWNNSWGYKKQLDVTETSGSSLTNYQVLVNVTYNANMQTDFDDIRFLNGSENVELDYWVEYKVDSSWAYVWIEVDALSPSQSNPIYMYYGNAGVSTTGNIQNTFIMGDDFEDGSVDFTTRWISNNESAYSEAGGYLDLERVSAVNDAICTQAKFGTNTFMYRISDLGSATDYYQYSSTSNTVPDAPDGFRVWRGTSRIIYKGIDLDPDPSNFSAWFKLDFQNILDKMTMYDTPTYSVVNVTTSVGYANNDPYLCFFSWVGGNTYIDWVAVRKQATADPTYVFGEEEIEATPPTVSLETPSSNNTNTYNPIVDFECLTSDNIDVLNVSLIINGTVVDTEFNPTNNTSSWFEYQISLGTSTWTCDAYDDEDTRTEADAFWITYANDLAITLGNPINTTNSSSNNIDFTGTPKDDTAVINVSFILNDVYNETDSTITNNTLITFNKILSDGSYTWNMETCDAYLCVNATAKNLTIDTIPHIQFEDPTPIDQFNSTDPYLSVNVTLTETYFDNLTFNFYLDGAVTNWNWNDDTRFNNESAFTEGSWEYNVTIWTTTGQSNSTETRTWNYDATHPVLNSNNLTDLNVFNLPTNSSWNFTATDDHLDTCWYSNVTGGTNYTITCNSQINTTWATQGNKTIQFCANDTFGLETCKTEYIWVYLLSYTQSETPDPIAEGFDAIFNFTINRTNIPVTTANLILNNTVYTPTATANTNSYEFGIIVTIPDGWGNTTGIIQDWYWNYTINGVVVDQDTSTENITVYELDIDDCSSYGELILNFSLHNEETNIPINESAGANVEVDLILTSKDDASISVTYSNTWVDENNPQVCLPLNVLNNSQYWLDLTVGFDSTDHVWEFFYIDDGTLNSTKIIQSFNGQTTSNINLMDLITADSTSFLFNYFDQDGLAVEEAIVHVMRKYIGDGVFREVERAKADQNGDTILHLVEEDVIYYFIITKNGISLFTSSDYTALCQAVPCSIQLEAGGEFSEFSTDYDLIDGGGYVITSSVTNRIVNLTYSLDHTADMNFSLYKYESDGSFSVVDTDTDTGSSGTIQLSVPLVAGNVSFFASVHKDNVFISSEWIDFESDASQFFGSTLALFLAGLIILTLGLVAVSEGAGTIVFVILGVIFSGALGLIYTQLSTGINIVIYLVLIGGLLIWKLNRRRS